MYKWNASSDEVYIQQAEYKKQRPDFKPYKPSTLQLESKYINILSTQNGSDVDDYGIDYNHKIFRYMKDIPKRSKILFLGVGSGREILAAKEFGLDAYGITLGSRNIDFGKSYLGLDDEHFIETVTETLPWQKETFDYVHGYQVFEHVISPIIFLLEIGRVLKFNGQLLLEWPPAKFHTAGGNPHHQICYIPGQADGLLQKSGFTNIKLFKETLDPIPEEDIWRGDQDYMMCISGIKTINNAEYIKQSWL